MLIMKSGKRHMIEEIELPNQEKIRTLGEMETWEFWKLRSKKKLKKSISGEPENYSNQTI